VLRRLRLLDYLALVVSFAVVGVFGAYAYRDRGSGAELLIQAQGGQWIYPLDQDRELTVDGPLGKTVISIRAGKARVTEATCRDKICISMGAISAPGAWIACLPNRVFLRVAGTDERTDAVSF